MSPAATLRLKPRQPDLPWLWLLLAFVLPLMLWSSVETVLREQQKSVAQLAMERAQGRAASYHRQIEDLIDRLDQVARMISQQWQAGNRQPDFMAVATGLAPSRYPTYLAITDRDGNVVASSFAPRQRRPADKDFLAALDAHQRGCCGNWQVAPPAFDALTGEYVVRFIRRLQHVDGSLSGLLLFAAPPNFLATFHDERIMNPGDFVTVRLLDGPVIATKLASDQPPMVFFRTHPSFPAGEGVARFAATDFVDDQARYVAWHRHPTIPLVSLAAINEMQVMAESRQSATSYRQLAAIGTIIIVVLSGAGAIASFRRRQREIAEQEVRAIYRAATDAANEGFFMLRPILGASTELIDLRVEDCNERGAELLGVDRASLLANTAAAALAPAIFADLLQFIRRGLDHTFVEEERRLPAHDNTPVQWLHRRAVVVGTGVALSVRDVTRAKEHEQHLLALAHRDALTGLPNRQWLMDFLPQAMTRADHSHLLLALMFIDLDHFKAVNDQLGHAAGDQLLCDVATTLSESVRSSDHIVRLAGDEFVVVLEGLITVTMAESIARKINDKLHQAWQQHGGPRALVNASIGISIYPDDAGDAESLLLHADRAMYAAKARGRAGYFRYRSDADDLPLAKAGNDTPAT